MSSTENERKRIEEEIGRYLDDGKLDHALAVGIREYGPKLRNILAAELRDRVLGDEAFSQFLENVYRGIKTFRRESPFWNWACRIAINAGTQVARHRGIVMDPVSPEEMEQLALAPAPRSQTAEWQKSEVKAEVRHHVQQLGDLDREIVALRTQDELPFKEIARRVQMDTDAVKRRFQRVPDKLRLLIERGRADDDADGG